MDVITHSAEETRKMGVRFGSKLTEGSVVCFFGELAAGKTTFIKGLAEGAAEFDAEQVNSPTYVYLNIYEGDKTIYHFDLYRLKDEKHFMGLGFDEMLFSKGICCIEWSERIASLLPKECIRVELAHAGGDQRKIKIHGKVHL